ncbi:MAG: O-antigen ligase family protein [Akkermansia sp.]
MQDSPQPIRFTDSLSGRLAAWILALTACAAMALSTNFVYSHVPALVGISLALLLALWGLLRGYRLPRLAPISWVSLAIGGYFYWRASTSYSQLEGANAMALVLGAAVFYGAGIYYGLAKRADAAMAAIIAFAIILNALYWYLARQGLGSLEWWGRPSMGLAGPNSPHTAFFLYKNLAAVFFASGGIYLMTRFFARAAWSWWRVLGLMLGFLSVGLSLLCDSRVPYLVIPLMLGLACLLDILLRIKSGKSMRWFDWCTVLAFVAAVAAFIYDMAGEQHIWNWLDGVDTHLRSYIWSYLMPIVPQASWLGFGAGACQWEIIPFYSEWSSPNYAHNEYLQAWVDFGLVGLLGMLFVLFGHLSRAMVSLNDAALSHERRTQVMGAVLLLVGLAAYAFVDFPWHHFAMVSFSAFLCGVLAAPKGEELRVRQFFASEGSRIAQERPATRLQQGLGRCCLIGLTLCLLAGTGELLWRFAPVWKADWQYNSMVAKAAPVEEQMQFLEQAITLYPEVDIVSWYRQYPWSRTQEGYQLVADMYEPCLNANPKHLLAMVKYTELLSLLGHYEEAESLLRDHYAPEGQPRQRLLSWPTYYGKNLLRWASHCYDTSQWAQAYSLYLYAYRMDAKSVFTYDIRHRTNNKQDLEKYRQIDTKQLNLRTPYMKAILKRIHFMRRVGVVPDHSWKQPMRPDGPPALYQRWGEVPSNVKK